MIAYILLAALVFGLCFLVDKGFSTLFRKGKEHRSGLAVRIHKRAALAGIALLLLAVATLFRMENRVVRNVGTPLLGLAGAGLLIYYLSFGVFYDSEGFALHSFGKKTRHYRYADITSQLLFNAAGSLVVELYLSDGRALTLQHSMDGVYPFLDTAFSGWCRQTGRDPEACEFHDPSSFCWFPSAGEGQ